MKKSKLINSKGTNKIIAILLVFCLITASYALTGISIAETLASELQEETSTKGSNMEFSALFKGEGIESRLKNLIIGKEANLCLQIKVNDKVALEDGVISMDNPNFSIKKDELVENKYITEVDTEANQIKLAKISSDDKVLLEVPVEFKKQNKISKDYLEKETIITLEGKYENENQKEKDYKGITSVKPRWKAESDVNLSQSIEKFFGLGERGTLLQQKITTEIVENTLPKNKEELEITVPTISGQKPNGAVVLVDGKKMSKKEMQYDVEAGLIKVTSQNEQDEDGNIIWQNKPTEYTIIYNFPVNLAVGPTSVTLKTTSHTYLYSNRAKITKEIAEDVVVNPVGNLTTLKTTLSGDLYKGYLYHNEDKKIEYKEKNQIEVSYKEGIEKLELQSNISAFLDSTGAKVADDSNTTYKQTQFNKEELSTIFGENFTITIKNQTGEIINQVTKDTQTDENGIITVSYNEGQTGIKIETSKPEQEGIFRVLTAKELSGKTDLNLQTLKSVRNLSLHSELSTNLSKETSDSTIELKEPISEAKLTSNTAKITTLKPTNVEINAVLLSNNEKQELYKNPKVQIKLPAQIEDVTVNSVNKLNADEFQLGATRLVDVNGLKVIEVEFVGEQTSHLGYDNEGIQIVVNASLKPMQNGQNVTSNIEMTYTNENTNNVAQTATLEFTIDTEKEALYNQIVEQAAAQISTVTSAQGQTTGNQITQEQNGLQIIATPSTVGKEINNGDTVLEGQTIRYNIEVTNNTGKELTNLKLEAKQSDESGNSNVNYFAIVEKIETQPVGNSEMKSTYYKEDETLTTMQMDQEKVEIGETVSFQYEFSIKPDRKNNETTQGTVEITADGVEKQSMNLMKNKIEEAELKLTTIMNQNEEIEFESGVKVPINYIFKNITNHKLKNVTVSITIPEGTSIQESELNSKLKGYSFKKIGNTIQINVPEIEVGKVFGFCPYIVVGYIENFNVESQTYSFCSSATLNGKTYYSNSLDKTALQKRIELEVTQDSTPKKEYAEVGDIITFTTTIINKGKEDKTFKIQDNLVHVAEIQEAIIKSGNQNVGNLERTNKYIYSKEYNLKAGETIQVVEKIKIVENTENLNEFSHYLLVSNENQANGSDTAITYKLRAIKEQPSTTPGTSNPNNPSDNGGNHGNNGQNGSLSNGTNLGSTQNTKFDLSLQKTVNNVTIYTSKGKQEKTFNNESLAKVEIHRRDINGAKVTVQYTIKVTNEGNTPGVASNIVDYLPNGFTLESAEGWTEKDGKLYTQNLSNQIIYPGESKEVTLTLSKIMSNGSTGIFANTAEIAEVINEASKEDADSKPANNKVGEDDISTAEVIISVGTGIAEKIAWALSTILGLALIGLVIYKTKVEEGK